MTETELEIESLKDSKNCYPVKELENDIIPLHNRFLFLG